MEGFSDDEDEEQRREEGVDTDIELNRNGLDEGSDDDAESDAESLDALEEKWSELEVSSVSRPHAEVFNTSLLGNRGRIGCRRTRPCSLH